MPEQVTERERERTARTWAYLYSTLRTPKETSGTAANANRELDTDD